MAEVSLAADPHAPSARAAMGLPEAYVERTEPLGEHQRALLGLSADLVARALRVLADQSIALGARIAAGTLLATVGDPRLDPLDPPMIDIPGGSARLGTDPSEVSSVVERWAAVGVRTDWILKECPAHVVKVDPFRLGRYPVTNEDFRVFLRDGQWPRLPASWRFGAFPRERANHPVWGVDEESVAAYIDWLSAATGRRFRLPTEAEWEYAATAGRRTEFPWGDDFDPSRANTVENGPLTTTPVGAYPAGDSPFGVADMAGNVEELVADFYGPYPGGTAVEDDLSLTCGAYRVTRGGSFTRFGDLARCSRRHGWFDRDIYVVGFRLAEDVTRNSIAAK